MSELLEKSGNMLQEVMKKEKVMKDEVRFMRSCFLSDRCYS